jgi:hypothetical protein
MIVFNRVRIHAINELHCNLCIPRVLLLCVQGQAVTSPHANSRFLWRHTIEILAEEMRKWRAQAAREQRVAVKHPVVIPPYVSHAHGVRR